MSSSNIQVQRFMRQRLGLRSVLCTGALLTGSLLTMVGSLSWAATRAAAESSSNLKVELDGFRNQKGQVCLAVFSDKKSFPMSPDKAAQRQCIPVKNGTLQVKFNRLSPGTYAIAVLHDENSDNQANRNFLGLPTEGFGFSRDPAIQGGPPKFSDSAILIAGPQTNIHIQLKYLLPG